MGYIQMAYGLVVGLLCVSVSSASVSEWSYIEGADNGPERWNMISEQCDGERQSPVSIDTRAVERKSAEKWTLSGWDSPSTWTIENKQYTVKFNLVEGEISTSGGMLGTTYDVAQFHFHWGSTNAAGSEHLVDGRAFPLEVHFVHKKHSFAGLGEALGSQEGDALAAVGFLFEIDNEDEDNVALEPVLEGILDALSSNDSKAEGVTLASLTSFLQESLDGGYYRYEGGLTTPTCDEVVIWTVFKTPITLSMSQMETFRLILGGEYGLERYRPVQPLGDRLITLYESKPPTAAILVNEANEVSTTKSSEQPSQTVYIIVIAGGSGSVATILAFLMAFMMKRKA